MEGLVLFAILGGLSYAIAHFLGKKRQIGFGWSLFFNLCFGPIIGLIITLLSRKYYDPNPQPSKGKKIWGWILIILFSLSVAGWFVRDGNSPLTLSAGIGFIGLGIYLIGRSKGKSFNSEALTKADD